MEQRARLKIFPVASRAGDPRSAHASRLAPGREAETQPRRGVNTTRLWLVCHVPSSGVKSN